MGYSIVIDKITRCFGAGAAATTVLNAVSISIPEGEFVSVVGPSGSGKSTLLNLIAGLDTPTLGHIAIAGTDIASLSDDARSDLRLHHMGIVFQNFNLLPTFTIEENVMFPLEFAGLDVDVRGRAHAALLDVGLGDVVYRRRPAELSGGEQQRAAIARALVVGPEILLADEPTGNLDSSTGEIVLDLLRRLNREQHITVVLVTHSALAATYGDRTIEMRDGRIIRDVRAPLDGRGRVVPLPRVDEG
jgi:putative ABC transport system ATP-binding protein